MTPADREAMEHVAQQARQAQADGRMVRYTVPAGELPRNMPKGRFIRAVGKLETWEFPPARVLEFMHRHGLD